MTTATPPVVRVPNLQSNKITDKDGNATDDELTFRHTLITNLQKLFGNEGCVVPTQSAANITIIQNNTVTNPGTGLSNVYTCQYGTILYDSTNNEIKIALNNGSDMPVFLQALLLTNPMLQPTAGALVSYAEIDFNGTVYKVPLYALS